MRLDLEVPGFTGFYYGIWEQGENEWREVHNMKYGEYEDFESLNLIDDWGLVLTIELTWRNCLLKTTLR